MKRNILNTLWMAAVLPLALVSCQQEELPGVTDTAGTHVFSITVTDGGYHSDGNAAGMTRATENGYSTEFTAGDACGLYIVRGSSIVQENVKLTATEQGGTLTWQPDAGVTLAGGLQGDTYFLYYPYREDIADKTDAAATTDDAAFFAPLISGWQPAEDQSDYATGYTASDLMTATGDATTSGGTVQLSFPMHHRMALAVIEMPTVTYKFANTTGGTITDYTVVIPLGFTYSDTKPCPMTDGTHRYLVNPASTAPSITGTYAYDKMEFTATLSGITAGQYKTYKPTNVIQHTLQVGDFLMADGTLVSKDETLTEEQKANVAAIVFWSPAETDPKGRAHPASLTDDKIRTADYPSCTHGLAVAVKTVTYSGSNYITWQNPYEPVLDFQNSENFTHDRKSDFVSVATDQLNNIDNMNRILGYQNTQVLLAYNKYCKDNGKGSYIVYTADAVAQFATTSPAPAGSTGWYLPSPKELHILCYKDADDVYATYNGGYTQPRDIVNSSLSAANGDRLETTYYWSSLEIGNYLNGRDAFRVDFYTAQCTYYRKDITHFVRAVCAF